MNSGGIKIHKINDYLWEIPAKGDMIVPARIYADRESIDFLLEESRTKQWDALLQIKNVAKLKGIQKAALAMADIHPGYGFPIGGVGAFDLDEGIVTLAGVGFDINCGVRSMFVSLERKDIEDKKEELAGELFKLIPAGLGATGSLKLTLKEIDSVLKEGALFSLNRGYGAAEDLDFIEDRGRVEGADPAKVSIQAKKRQLKQIGTLGSGNHYIEVQYVDKVYFKEAARIFGLSEGSVVVSIHTGSRALGHQIGTDYQKILRKASHRYGIPVYERELVGAPIGSREGSDYISAVRAGINCGFANRQAISGLVRKAFNRIFSTRESDIRTVYEVGHNNLKVEKHFINGGEKELLVHRKGATRAFGPGRMEVPGKYREVGHPVLVGGTMGTASYILVGTEKGMKDTFGSAVHGAGRVKSRKKARNAVRGEKVIEDLAKKGVIVMSHSKRGAAEESPSAYKNVDQVVNIMEGAGISRRVVRLRPAICVKG